MLKFSTIVKLYWWLPLASFYGMEAFHEAGHVLAGFLTGAELKWVELRPWQLSRTDFVVNPHPLAVVWAGPLVGMALPFVLWLILRRWRYGFLLRFFAGFCLVANGFYIGVGSFGNIGDCLEMLRHGTPQWGMVLFGLVSAVCGFILWNGQGRHFRGRPADHGE